MADNFKTIQIGGEFIDLDALRTSEYTSIDYSHEKIHNGLMFHAGYYAGTLANAGTVLFSVSAGTISPHIFWDISVGGASNVKINEGGTITGGTAVTVYNMERNNSGSCLTTCKHSGTLTGGTEIYSTMIPAGKEGLSGGQGRSGNEWIILKSKTSIMEIINVSGVSYATSIGVTFYEENE
jgi:hypothetical protein